LDAGWRGFLNELDAFRAYQYHPELNLPNTSNTAESTVNLIATMFADVRGFRTAKSLEMKCKGKIPQN
jgi:hypothetical protein